MLLIQPTDDNLCECQQIIDQSSTQANIVIHYVLQHESSLLNNFLLMAEAGLADSCGDTTQGVVVLYEYPVSEGS